MKTFFTYPIAIYLAASMASLCIMVLVDFVLGAEAEHLNAWVIINRWFGHETAVGDSLAIRHFGLLGASALMLLLNVFFGTVLLHLIDLLIRTLKG